MDCNITLNVQLQANNHNNLCYPANTKTLTQVCLNVGTPSSTLSQHWNKSGSRSPVCRVVMYDQMHNDDNQVMAYEEHTTVLVHWRHQYWSTKPKKAVSANSAYCRYCLLALYDTAQVSKIILGVLGDISPTWTPASKSIIVGIPANTRRWSNVGVMLFHRFRRWVNVNPTLDQRSVFAVMSSEWESVTLHSFLRVTCNRLCCGMCHLLKWHLWRFGCQRSIIMSIHNNWMVNIY